MEKKETETKTSEGRRNFLQASAVALLGLAMPEALAATPRASESLALFGGPKTVNFPEDKLGPLPAGHAMGRQKRMLVTN